MLGRLTTARRATAPSTSGVASAGSPSGISPQLLPLCPLSTATAVNNAHCAVILRRQLGLSVFSDSSPLQCQHCTHPLENLGDHAAYLCLSGFGCIHCHNSLRNSLAFQITHAAARLDCVRGPIPRPWFRIQARGHTALPSCPVVTRPAPPPLIVRWP